MAEIRWTIQAADELESIVNDISSDSAPHAKLFVIDIFNSIERLALFPESGRMVPEINRREIREIVSGNSRIIYRFRMEMIDILSIFHSSRWFDPKRIK
jgi:toxin ParE1/3/4